MPQDPLQQALMVQQTQPQAPDPNVPSIGPEPHPFTAAISRFASQHGLNPDDYKNPNTNPLLRMLGAARSVASTPVGQGALGLGAVAFGGGGAGELPFENPGLPSSPSPAPASPAIRSVFAANPKAEPAYNAMMKSQLPNVLAQREAANAAKMEHNTAVNQSLKSLDAGTPKMVPTETGFAIPIPRDLGSPTSSSNNSTPVRLRTAGLDVSAIREIRSMGLKAAIEKYPNLNANTLRGIVTGDAYSQIK